MGGVLLFGLRTATGLAWVARMGAVRPVRVRLVAKLDTPVTAGWRHPLILLPASLVQCMSAFQLDALLAHELVHIRRHDYALNLVQTVIVCGP